MALLIPLIGFLAGLLASIGLSKVNWCEVQQKYCSGKEHIACVPNSFSPNKLCRNVTLIPLDIRSKSLIVHLHNQYRNSIASGQIRKFPEAKKISVMKWDDTLEYLAGKHVSHCTFSHDQCRATPEFPHSGQNIFMQATLGHFPNATDAIERGLLGWFEEYLYANPSIIDRLTPDQEKVFHFTIMVSDQNNRLGCAMIQYLWPEKQNLFDAFMLTCNYEYTNILNEPVYRKGPSCSNCGVSGCSSTYKALCNS